jgi:hypothetical protein
VPESQTSRRTTDDGSVSLLDAEGGREEWTRGELRLRVLRSLPRIHERYFFEEIRKLCHHYLRNARVPATEIAPHELFSEVSLKLLATVSLPDDAASPVSNPHDWSMDLDDPKRDGRVEWLIEEVGGSTALGHRCEDIRRQRWGRAAPGGHRPFVQPGDDPIDSGVEPIAEDSLREADALDIWRGLLLTANREFSPEDDVTKLLCLVARRPGIIEDASGSRWPMETLAALLDVDFSPPPWNALRVENAKRRLTNWINRLMRKNGLDATDLEGLFARVERQQRSGEQTIPTNWN